MTHPFRKLPHAAVPTQSNAINPNIQWFCVNAKEVTPTAPELIMTRFPARVRDSIDCTLALPQRGQPDITGTTGAAGTLCRASGLPTAWAGTGGRQCRFGWRSRDRFGRAFKNRFGHR
ncbi:MAG: hypothetical protein KatS3mg105_2328 [Gemmatales bacterium]|nr:MAG: hypothetical protein KatS3mg105_2328 [Gemmatales bacterium]